MTQRIANHLNHRRRRGFTLVELLAAAMISALVATAATTLLVAVGNAATRTRDIRETKASGHFALRRIAESIRSARCIGQASSTSVTLWTADRNQNDALDRNEVGIITYDAVAKKILYTDSSISTTTGTIPLATFTNAAALKALFTAGETTTATWAEGVESFAFVGTPSFTQARIVDAVFTIGTGVDATSFQTSASPHASADYLFNTSAKTTPLAGSSRTRRILISEFTGW